MFPALHQFNAALLARMLKERISSVARSLPSFHITTPIFYPNAKPHIGHLYSSLLCDLQSRWHKLKHPNVQFTTGTDEHGLKIQAASTNMGFQDPKKFVDKLCGSFVDLYKSSNVDYTRFIRTTDQDHIANVVKLWNLCLQNGYIYKGDHSGWYSISDETFYPPNKIVRVVADRKVPLDSEQSTYDESGEYLNTETWNKVIYQQETNYFFSLSLLKDKLVELLETNPSFIFPRPYHQQIQHSLEKDDFADLSISRPSTRLKWGIRVPGDESQSIYVWFDALCNYITAIGGVDALLDGRPVKNKISARAWWDNTTHVIGKDIIKFHTIYWPAILMAAGLPLPKQVVVHGHWLSHGTKMSKSLGNVVDPVDMIQKYDSDAVRWYLFENSTLDSDGDFIEQNLAHTRELLCSKWGNLIHRCGGAKFSIKDSVKTFSGASIDELSQYNDYEGLRPLFLKLDSLVEELEFYLQKFDTANAIRHLWSIINDANTLFQHGQPWAKHGRDQQLVIFVATETARIASIASRAFIPELSEKFLDRLDVDPSKRTLDYARVGADSSYGISSNNKGRQVPISRKESCK